MRTKLAAALLALTMGAAGADGDRTDEMSASSGQTASSASQKAPTVTGLAATRLAFSDIVGWRDDDPRTALAAFKASCRAILAADPALRPGRAPSAGLIAICGEAATFEPDDADTARAFFEERFSPWRIAGADGGDGGDAFFTGYYEPEVDASLTPAPGFATALRARPADLVTWPPDAPPPNAPPGRAAALRRADGGLSEAPSRSAIDAGALGERAPALAYVRDPIEAFMIQVQGSARLRLPDGRVVRAVYDGRNGWPYASIGRVLVTERGLKPEDVTLEKLKAWVRAAGQKPGQDGLALLHRNESFVFFRLDLDAPPDAGPIGAQGLRLTPLRSLAVDRLLWPYGLPIWIDAALPWEGPKPTPFRRLTVAQDTGTAIVGPARADVFYGAGVNAGLRAGDTRHRGAFVALLPKGETP